MEQVFPILRVDFAEEFYCHIVVGEPFPFQMVIALVDCRLPLGLLGRRLWQSSQCCRGLTIRLLTAPLAYSLFHFQCPDFVAFTAMANHRLPLLSAKAKSHSITEWLKERGWLGGF